MRTRIAAAAVAAAALALFCATACSSGSGDKDAPPTHATTGAAAPTTSAAPATGSPLPRPPAPKGASRQTYLAALKAIDPSLASDPDKVVDEGRTQCTEINTDTQTADHLAAERFGSPGHPLTDAQGAAIDAALKLTVCKS
ncbi:hypothetical protein SAMN05216223_104133 [Actinacidiphila yanglinensis]|uniref:DUF732 domain-containing protein n=1 Tax=Actinacidiphila yanglinensis TaxID=310779 RepID=A0A1H5YU11_9ACTN|nr:hypothetical protein [Actinacidiphila yanglinensis]SEG27202.1 hypothetical protein SAMN05216223_104133 [Actinacidiphila yanglinensis]